MKKLKEYFNKKKINKIDLLLGIIFSLSFSCLSYQLMVMEREKLLTIVTLIISFLCGIYLFVNTFNFLKNNIKKNPGISIIFLILILIICYKYYTVLLLGKKAITSGIAIVYIGMLICYYIKKFVINFYKRMDNWDKKAYIITSIISIVLIVVLYSINSGWYLQYDKVYSLDSGWCFNNIFPVHNYYDIRHPLLSIFTFPFYALTDAIIPNVFASSLPVYKAVFLQFINSQLLIIIGLEIKQIVNNRYVYITYLLSFPIMLFSLFFEKYQLCVFLVVTYVYQLCMDKRDGKALIISSFGTMPTSAFIGISEFFVKNNIKEKLIKILKIIIITILAFICLGRIHCIKYGLDEIIQMKEAFGANEYTITERVISTTNMFKNTIFALPSNMYNGIYLWDNILSEVSYIGIIILFIAILGFIVNRKKLHSKIFISWSLFACILFIGLNWSIHESPLFSIYFSWAVIPLFIMGIDYIIEKMKLNKNIIYTLLYIFMFVINISTMINIIQVL